MKIIKIPIVPYFCLVFLSNIHKEICFFGADPLLVYRQISYGMSYLIQHCESEIEKRRFALRSILWNRRPKLNKRRVLTGFYLLILCILSCFFVPTLKIFWLRSRCGVKHAIENKICASDWAIEAITWLTTKWIATYACPKGVRAWVSLFKIMRKYWSAVFLYAIHKIFNWLIKSHKKDLPTFNIKSGLDDVTGKLKLLVWIQMKR